MSALSAHDQSVLNAQQRQPRANKPVANSPANIIKQRSCVRTHSEHDVAVSLQQPETSQHISPPQTSSEQRHTRRICQVGSAL
jgi:hypothetical protein